MYRWLMTFLMTGLLATMTVVAFAQAVLWVSDFENVEPGNPDPTWSNPDFIVQSIEGVHAYTAPRSYSGYSVYQTPVPAEHWLELRVRVDEAQSSPSDLDIIYRQGDFQLAEFGYIPSDNLFWATIPNAYCGVYYVPSVMEPGAWYRWLIYSEPLDISGYYHLQFKWWREGDAQPGWLITRDQYLCLDYVWMAEETEVSIVCTNASDFYVDWVEARVPMTRPGPRPIDMSLKGLLTAYPNPFNPATEISYSIPCAQKVSLRVFNLLGQEVAVLAEGMQSAGAHKTYFDGSNLPSGIYIYRLVTEGYVTSKKMALLK